ncbi:MAG: hypothetical protein V4641_12950 [Pseudomonadota bacterium]
MIEVTLKFPNVSAMLAAFAVINVPDSAVQEPAAPEAAPWFPPTPAAPDAPAETATAVVLTEPAPKKARKAKGADAAPAPAPATPETPITALFADPVPTPAPAVETAPTTATTVPSVDDCRAALTKVNEKFGMSVAYMMLTEQGAERVSLVPEAKRAEFIAACERKVA